MLDPCTLVRKLKGFVLLGTSTALSEHKYIYIFIYTFVHSVIHTRVYIFMFFFRNLVFRIFFF